MKMKKILLIAFAFVASIFVAQDVHAASYTINFNNFNNYQNLGAASTFGGISRIKYVKVNVTSTTGKYTVEFGRQIASAGSYEMVSQAISTYNGASTIYFIPQSMSCPSGYTTCVTVSESKPGVSHDYISDNTLRSIVYLKSKAVLGSSKMTGSITVYN